MRSEDIFSLAGAMANGRADAGPMTGSAYCAGRRAWVGGIRFAIPPSALDVVIEMKLVRMGTQPDGIDLLFSLVVQPGFDHVAGEHIA